MANPRTGEAAVAKHLQATVTDDILLEWTGIAKAPLILQSRSFYEAQIIVIRDIESAFCRNYRTLSLGTGDFMQLLQLIMMLFRRA